MNVPRMPLSLLLALLVSPAIGSGAAAELKHPLLAGKGGGDERLLNQFTDAQWLDLIPRQSPRQALPIPFGEGGVPLSKWDWSPDSPNQITAKSSGEVYPDAKLTPKTQKVLVLSGKTVDVPYFDGKRGRIYPQARIDYSKFIFIEGAMKRLGPAYAGTGDERYAHLVAIVLDAWANYVPDYYITGRGSPVSPDEAEKEKWFVARVSEHNEMAHEWPHFSLEAFDCIYDSKALQDLSARREYDVRAHIARDLFGNIGDVFARRIKPEWATMTNLSLPYMVMADAATILDRPDYIEYLNDYLAATTQNFCRDHMFPESFLYHRGYAGANLNVAQNVAKFFTLRPAGTAALRETQARSAERLTFLKRCVEAPDPVCYPDGVIPPFGDSSAANDHGPRDATRSAVLPAYGFVALGDGSGKQQTQLDLGFNEFNNHCQADVLGFTLFGFGAEVIGNNRYARSAGRAFNNSTLGHNTVVIDRENQFRKGDRSTGGNLTLYEPGLDGIAVAEVDGIRAYAGKASRYQRLMILNTVDPAHPYAVDLFAVAGGRTHDYVLHGATTLEQDAKLSFAAAPMAAERPLLVAGENWQDPKEMGDAFPLYGMIQEVSEGRSPGTWDATFLGRKDPLGSRLFMVDDKTNQVFIGRSPVIGGEAGHPDPKKGAAAEEEETPGAGKAGPGAAYARFMRPAVLVRREATSAGPLRSLFVGVIEPVKGASVVAGVERLPLQQDDPEAVALRIRFLDGRTDVVLVNMDNPSVGGCPAQPRGVATREGGYLLQGRVGVCVSPKQGGGRAVMVGASRFQYGKVALSLARAAFVGAVEDVKRRHAGDAADAFVTSAELPAGDSLKGRWLSLGLGTYTIDAGDELRADPVREQKGIRQQFQIDRVETRDGKTWILLSDDPAMVIKDGKLIERLRPHRSFDGPRPFEISSSASSNAPSVGASHSQ